MRKLLQRNCHLFLEGHLHTLRLAENIAQYKQFYSDGLVQSNNVFHCALHNKGWRDWL